MCSPSERHAPALAACKRLALPLLAFKASLFLSIFLSLYLLPPMFFVEAFKHNFHWPPDRAPVFADTFRTCDAQQYLYLSEHGYKAGMMPSAFYPLWPFLIRAGSFLCGGSHLIAGLILANVFSWLGLLAFHYLVHSLEGEETANASLLLLLAYPGAIFFLFIYTESLFLMLSVFFFIFLSRDRYGLASIFALLLPLTRSVGILILLPFAFHMLNEWRRNHEFPKRNLLFLSAPLAGFCLYLLVLYLATGNPFEGFAAQRLFIADSSVGKVADIAGFLRELANVTVFHGLLGSLVDRVWFALFLIGLPLVWRKNKDLFFYALPVGLVPAMTVSLMAFTRYALVVFPVFMAFGAALSGERRRAWLLQICALLFIVQIFFLVMHINNMWVG
jgi:hypothetical protein